jgi:hypothetical protein
MIRYHSAARVVAILSLFIGSASIVGCGSAPITAPTSYGQYNAKDGTFACEYPEGWSADGGGKGGPLWATFASGAAEIRANADVAGSLMGGLVGGGGGFGVGDDESMDLEPVRKIHDLDKERAEQKYTGYQEIGDVAVVECGVGPARRSEFTSTTTFGSGLHGYRATILGHDKRVVVYCVCPESDWKTLEPAFAHVLRSFKRGNPE